MIYYIKLDEEAETLEVKQVKNIHQLAQAIKVAWIEVNNFLNGTDKPTQWLGGCTMTFPYIRKNGECYYFSYYKPIIEGKNYKWMSREVISELRFMNEFEDVKATSSKVSEN